MYSAEYLARYPFFREALRETPLSVMHDAMTGLIARPFILRFVQALIAEQTPFVLGIVDLDNFKSINDNYGHRTGDEMLTKVGEELRLAVGEDGVVGRYGGDEFLFVYFGCTDYDGIHRFLDGFYAPGGLFRKNILVRDKLIFSTATIGCTVYPQDADSFEGLFALVDKTLYRGKSKGRNCFIIYVPAKHAHLEIPTLARHNLFDTFYHMAEGFDSGATTFEKLKLGFAPVREYLRMHHLFFIDTEYLLHDMNDGQVLGSVEPPDSLLTNGLFASHSMDELSQRSPSLVAVLQKLQFDSVLLCQVSRNGKSYGFLVFCPEVLTFHIWQESECAAAFFFSRMLAQHLEELET